MNKRVLICLVLAHLILSGSLFPQRKALSVREQVNQFLGGTVVQVERNNFFPATSLVQRITLIVDRNGVKSVAYMDVTVDKELNILSRKVTSDTGSVFWVAAPALAVREEPIPGYDYKKCMDECRALCSGKRTASERVSCWIMCSGACDLIFKYSPSTAIR